MKLALVTAIDASLTFFGGAAPGRQTNKNLTETLLKAGDAADRAREAADAARLIEGRALDAAKRARVASQQAPHVDAATWVNHRNGFGVYWFRNGDRYEGSCKDGVFEGGRCSTRAATSNGACGATTCCASRIRPAPDGRRRVVSASPRATSR